MKMVQIAISTFQYYGHDNWVDEENVPRWYNQFDPQGTAGWLRSQFFWGKKKWRPIFLLAFYFSSYGWRLNMFITKKQLASITMNNVCTNAEKANNLLYYVRPIKIADIFQILIQIRPTLETRFFSNRNTNLIFWLNLNFLFVPSTNRNRPP